MLIKFLLMYLVVSDNIINVIGGKMIVQILILIVGFVVLIKGADFFVDGASSSATNFKVPKILIGLTIVAFGTSAPEFAVSIKSISLGNHDIVLGNVIGSNIMNILLILGCSSLVHSLVVKNNTIKKELPFVILLTSVFAVLLLDSLFNPNAINSFTRSDGIILFLVFLVFIYYLISISLDKKNFEEDDKKKYSLKVSILLTILGIVMIVFGSDFVVKSASKIASMVGVSEKLIALTVVALGTSLPELVTSITATKKGEYDLAIGNIVGSNIFNLGIVVGLPVMIFGGVDKINFNYIDILVMISSAILLFVFSLNDKKITWKEGIIFLAMFLFYYSYVIMNG